MTPTPDATVRAVDLASSRPYGDPSKPGRLDVNGVEWWACDPYPTWFRWDDMDKLTGTLHTNPARWADLLPIDNAGSVMAPEDCWGSDNHEPDCDQVIRTRWSGVSCDCRARWYCD